MYGRVSPIAKGSKRRGSRWLSMARQRKVSTLELVHSPHAAELGSVTIYYREFGSGRPLVFLHGGWGYGVYPFDQQIEAFEKEFRILVRDMGTRRESQERCRSIFTAGRPRKPSHFWTRWGSREPFSGGIAMERSSAR